MALESFNGKIVWTDPFPYDCSPRIIARLWSWSAPATISDADADPWFIRTIIGLSLAMSPPDAVNLDISFLSLPFIDTISPDFRKLFVTFADWSNKPPGLFLKSIM